MSASLYTLRAIAGELGLPESTIRYYRDLFGGWLPVEGRGRRRRYPAEAIDLFRLIAEGYAQNRDRREIEAALTDASNGRAPIVHQQAIHVATAPEPLLATVLEGERERREVMWQMAREIVRLGEALERQHAVLHELVRRLDAEPRRALPASPAEGRSAVEDGLVSLDEELSALRRELEVERDLVERLRKSKLELERRAAEAEAALAVDRDAATVRGGLLRRVLRRDGEVP
jgi:DNA-binding transcriptional MerR regulator